MNDALRWKAAQERPDKYHFIPPDIWDKPEFQDWLAKMRAVGNELVGATFPWVFLVSKEGKVFAWAMHVDIEIAAEGRHKSNEFVIFRNDIGAVVLYSQPQFLGPNRFRDTKVVLVKEFRSPARNAAAYVYELPGGGVEGMSRFPSVFQTTALREALEETGVDLGTDRVKWVEIRQLAATLAGHVAGVAAIELTPDEMAQIEARVGEVNGVDEEERAYLEVWTIGDILTRQPPVIDWSNVGMILAGVLVPGLS